MSARSYNSNKSTRMAGTRAKVNKLMYLSIVILSITTITIAVVTEAASSEPNGSQKSKDLNRKSIVFDLKTPKVFYCPQEKPADLNKLIVKARPLDKLCEFGGKSKPKNEPSDCYNDVDETEFACDEKKRFMLRLDLSGELENPSEGIDDLDYILAKASGKKKATTNGKKY